MRRVDEHPQRTAWLTALSHMLEAEHRYFDAVARRLPDEEKEGIRTDLRHARQAYWDITDNLDTT